MRVSARLHYPTCRDLYSDVGACRGRGGGRVHLLTLDYTVVLSLTVLYIKLHLITCIIILTLDYIVCAVGMV